MSSNAEHRAGATEPRELTNPVLWTAGLLVSIAGLAFAFFHFKEVGREHSKGEQRWAVATAGGGEPDHQALSEDRSQAVLDRGEALYAKNCVSCHGTNGDAPVGNPPPRNFHTEAFKNPLGGGPYGFYDVLTKGYKSMPAYSATLSAEDRYAVAHYVRESFMKPKNPAYVAKDDAKIVAQIPAKGAGGGAAAAELDPQAINPAAPTFALMAVIAQRSQESRTALHNWLGEARVDCGKTLTPVFAHFDIIFGSQNGRIGHLHAAAMSKDRPAFDAVLMAEDGAGSADPFFSLLPAATVDQLYTRLTATATRTK